MEETKKSEFCLVWSTKHKEYMHVETPWSDEDLKDAGFVVKGRFQTREEAIEKLKIIKWKQESV